MAKGKKPIKNGMHRLKALIFNDYRFKTQHQYKNYKNDTPFEMIEFREFFAVTLRVSYPRQGGSGSGSENPQGRD